MQQYAIIPYNRKNNYKENAKMIISDVQEFLLGIQAFLLGLLAVLRINKKRVTNLFTVRWGNIYQDVNKEGCADLKKERIKLEGKTINSKLFVMAKVFKRQLIIVLKELEVGKTYRTKTHILSTMKKAEENKELKINNYKKAEKRILTESIWFLGRKDFFKLLFSKDRYKIYKQFYKVNFTRL